MTYLSSDMSCSDFDIPFTIAYVVSYSIDLVTTILVMGVTWPVLIIAVPALLVAAYTQVNLTSIIIDNV